MTGATKDIRGADLRAGDRVQLDDGKFVKVNEIVKAPVRIEHEDGTRETPRWAHLSNGEHATVCKDDVVTVAA